MTSMPPGWYDDGRGALRWWDGAQWTEHVAVPDPETDESDTGGIEELPPELAESVDDSAGEGSGAFGAATDGSRSSLWVVWAVLGVVLLGIVVAIAVIIPLLFLNHATSDGSVLPFALGIVR